MYKNHKYIQSAHYRTSHAYYAIQNVRALQFILSRGLLKLFEKYQIHTLQESYT